MLDMCDPHDFCYRETRQASCHTYTLIFGDPEAHIHTNANGQSVDGHTSLCWGVTYATHECRVDSYWRACSSYRWGRETFGYQFCARLNYKICLTSKINGYDRYRYQFVCCIIKASLLMEESLLLSESIYVYM